MPSYYLSYFVSLNHLSRDFAGSSADAGHADGDEKEKKGNLHFGSVEVPKVKL